MHPPVRLVVVAVPAAASWLVEGRPDDDVLLLRFYVSIVFATIVRVSTATVAVARIDGISPSSLPFHFNSENCSLFTLLQDIATTRRSDLARWKRSGSQRVV